METVDLKAQLESHETIANYIRSCEARIPSFVRDHFSFEQTWNLQKPSLYWDLAVGPLNSLWAIPYLSVKKISDMGEKMGFPHVSQFWKDVPSGLRTGYQKRIERLIYQDVLAIDPKTLTPQHRKLIQGLIDQFLSARAMISDLASMGVTMLFGWYFFGNTSLNLNSMAYGFAKRRTHDEAASGFFLGKGVGNTFYELFPPEVSQTRVRSYLLGLGILFTLGTFVCTVVSDPLRKALGFHQIRLRALLKDLEKDLILARFSRTPTYTPSQHPQSQT